MVESSTKRVLFGMGIAFAAMMAGFFWLSGAVKAQQEVTPTYRVGDCLTYPEQEEWDHEPVYIVQKVGKRHYLLKDCNSDFTTSESFLGERRWDKVSCPQTCKKEGS